MGHFAYRLAETFDHYEELDRLGSMPIVEVVYGLPIPPSL
jgi:hypothetical protein